MKSKTREIALSGILFALAMALSYAESMIAPLLGLMPGVKLGLSNVVVMYALFFMGTGRAFTLGTLKAFFVLLTRGPVAGLLSLCGGLFSIGVMWLLYRFPRKPTWYILSVSGSLAHNVGQMIGASLVLGSALTMGYAPVLILSGLAMGALTATGLSLMLPALERLGYHLKK